MMFQPRSYLTRCVVQFVLLVPLWMQSSVCVASSSTATAQNHDDEEETDELELKELLEIVQPLMLLVRQYSQQGILHRLDKETKVEIQRFFTTQTALCDSGSEHCLAVEATHSFVSGIVSSMVNQIGDKAFTEPLQNIIAGKAPFGNLTGTLYRKNYIPLNRIESLDPVFVGGGYHFLKVGPKPTKKWINVLRYGALASVRALAEGVALGAADAAVDGVMFGAFHGGNRVNQLFGDSELSTSDSLKESLLGKRRVQYNGSAPDISLSVLSKVMHRFSSLFYQSVDEYLLPLEELTGFYTIKEGHLHLVMLDNKSTRKKTIEKYADAYGYFPRVQSEEAIERGLATLGKPVFPKETWPKAVLKQMLGFGMAATDAFIDYGLNFALLSLYNYKLKNNYVDPFNPGSGLDYFSYTLKQQFVLSVREMAIKKPVMILYHFVKSKLTNQPKQEFFGVRAITCKEGEAYFLNNTQRGKLQPVR